MTALILAIYFYSRRERWWMIVFALVFAYQFSVYMVDMRGQPRWTVRPVANMDVSEIPMGPEKQYTYAHEPWELYCHVSMLNELKAKIKSLEGELYEAQRAARIPSDSV